MVEEDCLHEICDMNCPLREFEVQKGKESALLTTQMRGLGTEPSNCVPGLGIRDSCDIFWCGTFPTKSIVLHVGFEFHSQKSYFHFITTLILRFALNVLTFLTIVSLQCLLECVLMFPNSLLMFCPLNQLFSKL